MERQRPSTVEILKEDLAGTTYSTYSAASKAGLTVVYDPSLHRLNLLIQSGDYVFQSEWLDCEPQLPMQVTAAHTKEAVRLWLLLTGLHSRGLRSGLTPLELVSRTMKQFEHVLA